jgi:predicted transposase YdaD
MLGLGELRETKVYQEALHEGEQTGEARLVLRQLTRRIGSMAPEVLVQIQLLSLPQLESLGEALLDFSQPDELVEWLRTLGA